MANGKLARYAEKNRSLRAENRELNGSLAEIDGRHNPGTLRKFIALGLKNGTAYGTGRLFVYGQQKGWMPTAVPVDGLLGIGVQVTTAFFHGPMAAIAGDIGDGMAGGAMGRMAAFQQLEETEIAGRKALLLPAAPAANGGNGNGA